VSETPRLRFGAAGTEEAVQGYLRAVPVEGRLPSPQIWLHTHAGEWVAIYIEGDHPLENLLLQPLIDKEVALRGRWKGSRLRVQPDDLHLLPPPVEDVDG